MRARFFLLLALGLPLSIALAYAMRDLVHDKIVVPLYHALWQLSALIQSVPELVRWAGIITVMALVLAWQLVPEWTIERRPGPRRDRNPGQVETVARWITRSRSSNYFKWQIAHRLGALVRRLQNLTGQSAPERAVEPRLADYLKAGLSLSFVDFPSRRGIFGRPTETALDLDPGEVIASLEQGIFADEARHADSL